MRRLAGRIGLWCAMALITGGCARHGVRHTDIPEAESPPPFLLGTFEDDYGIAYHIGADAWRQGARTTYEVKAWNPAEQFVIARNALTNPSAPELWTRIDWMLLEGMSPYTWAYCLSAYEAPTREAAAATRVAQRASPRTGCNGFPFSRMKRIVSSTP